MLSRLVASSVLLSLAGAASARADAAPDAAVPTAVAPAQDHETGAATEGPPGPPPPPPDGGASPPAPPLVPAPVAVDLRPRIFVKDLDHLAELVKDDPRIAAQARSIASRRTTALTVGGVTIAASSVVFLTGMGNQTCRQEPVPFPGSGSTRICQGDPTQTLIGAGIAVAGSVLTALLWPTSSELLDVINDWNVAHPDRPFELSGGHHPLLDQVAVPGQR